MLYNMHIKLEEILDNLHEAILITDAECIVRYINLSYTKLRGVKKEDILNKHLMEVNSQSILPEVVRTGICQLGKHRKIGDAEFFSNIVPIFQGGKIIGGLSVSSDISDIIELNTQFAKIQENLEDLKRNLANESLPRYKFDDIISTNAQINHYKQLARKFADTNLPVLIVGESGSGKELFAQSIHNASTRRYAPFIAVNCATLNSSLLESELFGYADSSFTGAKRGGKKGLFEEAKNGTIFLDEIGELENKMQAKLLRALQEGMIRPIGSSFEKRIDVRVISATNKNLFDMCQKQTFRTDLYFRLASVLITLPPLREHKEDIIPLAQHFLNKFSTQTQRQKVLDPSCFPYFLEHEWPGNVRELYNYIRVVSILCDRDIIYPHDLPDSLLSKMTAEPEQHQNKFGEIDALAEAVQRAEKRAIEIALQRYGKSTHAKKMAAAALGISIATLYNKIKVYGLN